MIATFIFCCLFIFSNIKNGQSNDSIVDNMNQLFKQKFWKEYLFLTDITVKDGHNNFVTIFANTIDAESGEQCVTEENINEKKRAAYMIVHYYYSYMVHEIVFMFVHMIKVNVLPNDFKKLLDKFDMSFSKIRSSLELLSSGYKGDDLPNLVQSSIDRLENATNKAYKKSSESTNNGEVDMSNILNNLLETTKEILDPLDQFIKDCAFNHPPCSDDEEQNTEKHIMDDITADLINDELGIHSFHIFLSINDINKFYQNTGFKYNEETKTSSINQTRVEPINLHDADFKNLNV